MFQSALLERQQAHQAQPAQLSEHHLLVEPQRLYRQIQEMLAFLFRKRSLERLILTLIQQVMCGMVLPVTM